MRSRADSAYTADQVWHFLIVSADDQRLEEPWRFEQADNDIIQPAMAQRADCIMLNKGPYIEKAVRMLDKVVSKMQRIQKKNLTLLPKLEFNESY